MWVHRHTVLVSCVQTSIKASYKKQYIFIQLLNIIITFLTNTFFYQKWLPIFKPPPPSQPSIFKEKMLPIQTFPVAGLQLLLLLYIYICIYIVCFMLYVFYCAEMHFAISTTSYHISQSLYNFCSNFFILHKSRKRLIKCLESFIELFKLIMLLVQIVKGSLAEAALSNYKKYL